MAGKLSAAAVAAGIAAATIVLTGCGGSDRDDDLTRSATAAVTTLQDAYAARDWRTICRHLTGPAHQQAGSVAHGIPTVSCPRDVQRAFGVVGGGGGFSRAMPLVSGVRERDGGATVTLSDRERRWRADVPLADRGGDWKLAGFFGAAPAAVEAIERSSRARPFPEPTGAPVEAVDQRGRPCGDLDTSSYPDISGGCSFRVATRSAPIRMLTPFGSFKFSDCRIFYRVSIDASGRTWTDRWGAADLAQPGCSDVDPCKSGSFDLHPWKGRLTRDARGGYSHVMDMCMRTCIGLFTGKLVMRLVRYRGGWRVMQTDAGESGFRIAGPLAVAPGSLRLRS